MSAVDRRRLGLLLALAPLGGCVALEFASSGAPRLFGLTPKSNFADELPTVDARLAVEVPTATAGLNTSRIALRPTPTTIEYYAGASWIDVLPVLVQTMLIESLDNVDRIDVLGREVVGVRADYALLLNVREFQAEYESLEQPPLVRVRLQARLVRLPRRTSIGATSMEREARAASTDIDAIVAAFDDTFGKVVRRVVAWTLETVAADL